MRILYHHRTRSEDAQGVHITEMIRAFRGLGHDVDVAALVRPDEGGKGVNGGGWQRMLPGAPSRLYELMSLAYNAAGYLRLARQIRRRRPDLIYERYSLNTFCGIWASRRFAIPLLLEVNAPLYHEQRQLGRLAFGRLARFSERWICSHSTRTIVVSQAMKDILAAEGVPGGHMVVMANGIDPSEIHPRVSGEAVRRRYGLDEAVVLGFVGWFRPWHGLEMLVEVVHEARLTERGVRLLLVGDGPARTSLKQAVQARGLNGAVILTGPVPRPDIPAHIAAMDVAVQPSATAYACPMKIPEYLGMAKCVVAPDQPNIRELLEDGVTAVLFRAGDKESLRAALERVVGDPVKRRQIGERGLQSVFERGLLWRANAERALALLTG
jgi:glycosyltransferase involved in cell wall biosynthesis